MKFQTAYKPSTAWCFRSLG